MNKRKRGVYEQIADLKMRMWKTKQTTTSVNLITRTCYLELKWKFLQGLRPCEYMYMHNMFYKVIIMPYVTVS